MNYVFKDIHTFSTRAPLLNAFFIVRERNSSQASKLERDSKRKSFIYSSILKN